MIVLPDEQRPPGSTVLPPDDVLRESFADGDRLLELRVRACRHTEDDASLSPRMGGRFYPDVWMGQAHVGGGVSHTTGVRRGTTRATAAEAVEDCRAAMRTPQEPPTDHSCSR